MLRQSQHLCVLLTLCTFSFCMSEEQGPPSSGPVCATSQPTSRIDAKLARRKVLGRRRRVIFNDDSYETSRKDADTPEGFLCRRLQPLVGTHVDTISFSVLGGWGDAPIYDSEVQPIFGDAHGGPPNVWSGYTARNVRALIRSGKDALQVAIDFAHKNEMELFASMRMNDCHDSFLPPLITLWKKAHPELLVDRGDVPQNKDAHPLGLYVTAQDYSHKEVRDRKFEIIEEVCHRYDVDGVDLNFIRHPMFFSRGMRGEPASDDETEIMTNFLRRIRKFTDERAMRRGRPILLAAIVPDNFRLARNIGLDVKTWIKNDLIDIVIPGLGYAPFSLPVREFTDYADAYGVKVYPCINRKAPQQVDVAHVADGFRGVAANWYRAGADGIFFWNLGTPLERLSGQDLINTRNLYYGALPELGDPQAIEHKDKLFCLDDEVLNYYQHATSQRPLPVALSAENTSRAVLEVGDDVSAEKDRLKELTLILQFQGKMKAENLLLKLNGRELPQRNVVADRDNRLKITVHPDPSMLKLGSNFIEASFRRTSRNATGTVQLDLVRLWVKYKEVVDCRN